MTAATTSIPTKYQTIVTSNADKKGFSCQAKRFSDDYYMVNNILRVLWYMCVCLLTYLPCPPDLYNISRAKAQGLAASLSNL